MKYNLEIIFKDDYVEEYDYDDEYYDEDDNFDEYDYYDENEYYDEEDDYFVNIVLQHIDKKKVDISIVIPKSVTFDKLIKNGKLKEMIKNTTENCGIINNNDRNLYEEINNMSNDEFIKKNSKR